MKRTAGVMAVIACGKSGTPPPPAPPPAVETVMVVSRPLNMIARLPAQLIPFETVDVYPKVTGFLDDIHVDVGSRVTQGDVLMRLSAPELVAQKAQASAALRAAESRLASARAKLASDDGTYGHLSTAAQTPGVVAANDVAVAKQTVEADRGEVGAAEQNVSAARDSLRSVAQMESYLTITAPFDGTVTRRNLHPGALVGPASAQSGSIPIIQIVDTRRLRMIVPVPEGDVGAMTLGKDVAFSVPAYLGETFHAPIARIAHDIDLKTRTMHVELDVQNPVDKLAPGSFATVLWPVERDHATLFVPTTAVATDQQRTFVIRVSNGKAAWVTVQTGQSDHGEIEVAGDLHAGDRVVSKATDSIRDGDEVTVKQAGP